MKTNEVNENEEKSFLDRVQENFYVKRKIFDDYILKLSLVTLGLMIFAIITSSWLQNFFIYLNTPFILSLFVTAILSIAYFVASLFFLKRKTEKALENARTFKEKCLKFFYKGIKYLVGLSFIWTLLGDTIFSMIFQRPVHLIGEGYNQISVKLFICFILLVLFYCAIVFISFSARLIGFSDKISKNESILNLASKRSFAMFLGGFFLAFTLLFTSITIDNKILVALNRATNDLNQIKKTYKGF